MSIVLLAETATKRHKLKKRFCAFVPLVGRPLHLRCAVIVRRVFVRDYKSSLPFRLCPNHCVPLLVANVELCPDSPSGLIVFEHEQASLSTKCACAAQGQPTRIRSKPILASRRVELERISIAVILEANVEIREHDFGHKTVRGPATEHRLERAGSGRKIGGGSCSRNINTSRGVNQYRKPGITTATTKVSREHERRAGCI